MTQHVALTENPGLIPRTTWWLTTVRTVLRDLMISSASSGNRDVHAGKTLKHIKKKKTKKVFT